MKYYAKTRNWPGQSDGTNEDYVKLKSRKKHQIMKWNGVELTAKWHTANSINYTITKITTPNARW